MNGHGHVGAATQHRDTQSAHVRREDGWYLYGITSVSSGASVPALAGATELGVVEAPLDSRPDQVRLQLLISGNLAAVVRRVDPADYSAEALQARLGDPAMLKLAVQSHNDVVYAIHQKRPILPSRFGAVYARLEDIAEAIDRRYDTLLAQLSRLDGCDEWAIHIYVDQQRVRAAVEADHALAPVLQRLATTSPGRAYFLRRRLDDSLAATVAAVTDDLALAAYKRLAQLAVDSVVERPAGPPGDPDSAAEVLRAAFLVRRERSVDFITEACSSDTDERAWCCTSSGPWPPYSFAAITEGAGDDRHDT